MNYGKEIAYNYLDSNNQIIEKNIIMEVTPIGYPIEVKTYPNMNCVIVNAGVTVHHSCVLGQPKNISLSGFKSMVALPVIGISLYCITYLEYYRQEHYKITDAHYYINPSAGGVHVKNKKAPKPGIAFATQQTCKPGPTIKPNTCANDTIDTALVRSLRRVAADK
uniref:Uncharacterized protein n=1 Tax=Glossina brevipalpis TaxID=37001 RepID=A0A1A9W756_9MUSC